MLLSNNAPFRAFRCLLTTRQKRRCWVGGALFGRGTNRALNCAVKHTDGERCRWLVHLQPCLKLAPFIPHQVGSNHQWCEESGTGVCGSAIWALGLIRAIFHFCFQTLVFLARFVQRFNRRFFARQLLLHCLCSQCIKIEMQGCSGRRICRRCWRLRFCLGLGWVNGSGSGCACRSRGRHNRSAWL